MAVFWRAAKGLIGVELVAVAGAYGIFHRCRAENIVQTPEHIHSLLLIPSLKQKVARRQTGDANHIREDSWACPWDVLI